LKELKLFLALAALYLALALVGRALYFGTPRPGPSLYAVLFLLLVALGTRFEVPKRPFLASLALLFPLGPAYILPGLSALLLPRVNRETLEKALVVVSLAIALGSFLLLGIPLLSPELRSFKGPLIAGDLLMLAVALKPRERYLLLGGAIAVLSASRTVALGIAAAYTFRKLREGTFSPLPLLVLGTAMVARHYVTLHEYGTWSVGILGTLLHRPGTSYVVYEKLFEWGYPLGRWELLFMPDPTAYVGSLFGKSVGYTYTIFGQPAYDFGLLGLVEGFLLGTALRASQNDPFTGSFALAVATISLDIGLEAVFLAAIGVSAYLAGVMGDG